MAVQGGRDPVYGGIMGKFVECVPNFSEGRDLSKINAIVDAARAVPGR